jgi:hypothetical protein
LTRVRHHGFKRFEIGMNVTENCKPHLPPPPKSENVTTELVDAPMFWCVK